MRIQIYKKNFPRSLLSGWYWEIRTINSGHNSGPYRTMKLALKDIMRHMRFQVSMLHIKT